MGNIEWFLIAFVCYLIVMVVIGATYAKQNTNSEDYFLGGRKLTGWVAAMSAQASDMSGWLLLGLPGSVYALGTGQSWIAIGLLIGTVVNWLVISKRLRRYTIAANNSLTIPRFFQNRFEDDKKVLLGASSVVIVIFFLVYTASAFASGGKLFNSVFGVDYHIALTIGVIVILAYTYMGGFLAVCTTDLVQGLLMLVALMLVPILAYGLISGDITTGLTATGVNDAAGYLNIMRDGDGNPITFVSIISQLAWGLGYCGMPHVLVRFMAVKDEKELSKSKVIAIIWVILSLTLAVVIGVVGRAYLPTLLTDGAEEKVFIEMIIKVFTQDIKVPLFGGLFLCGILAAIMSTADSQLLVSASAVSEDIYTGVLRKEADDDKILRISRITVLSIAVIAYFIAWNPNSSIMKLVSDAWAGLGAAFGPTVVMALFWRRTNLAGAVAGVVSGAATVILWDYIPLMGGQTLGDVTGLYSLLVGFFISLILIVVVSLATKAPSETMLKTFDDVKSGNVENI
ncbi:MAG: sodium/proline symporter PutP [Lachnospiraceae bacterium]|nr:sodium/proline symporter PutP [Lachnospiraceae bacterium]